MAGDAVVEVDVRDSLRDVLTRLPPSGLVRLHIPPGCPLFVTAAEFGALKDAADRSRLAVIVHSTDPLRLQLARMLGLATVAASPGAHSAQPLGRPVPAPDRATPRATPPSGLGAAPSPADRGGIGPWGPGTTVRDDAPAADEVGPISASGAGGDVATPVRTEPDPPPSMTRLVRQVLDRERDELHRPLAAPSLPAQRSEARSEGQAVDESPVAALDREQTPPDSGDGPTWASVLAELEAPGHDRDGSRPSRGGRRRVSRRLAAALAAVLALALLAGGAVALLPRARVVIELAHVPVRTELVYAIAPPGVTAPVADLTIPAEPLTREVTVSAAVPTTGVRREPEGTATGTVRLSNPNPEPVVVEAGTTIAGGDGVEFAFVDDVEVPAGAPAEGRYGSAQAEVRAVEPGTVGNLETGALGGRLPSGVYFSNRDGGTEGGTDREVQVVADADLANLRARLESALPARAEEAVTAELPEGSAIALESLTFGEIEPRFDHEAGDEATQVAAEAVVPVTVLTYRRAEAEQEVRRALRERLDANRPPEHALDDRSMTVTEPEPLAATDGGSGVRYRVAAEAAAVPDFTDARRRELADDLTGKEAEDAEAIVRALPGVEDVELSFRPGWLPERMPRWAGAIEIEIRP